MIIGRHSNSVINSGKALPHEWQESFVKILTDTYEKRAEADNSFFDLYGEVFDEEILVIISYLHREDYSKSPISIFISHDMIQESKGFSSCLDQLVNLTGLIFDDIFNTEYWNDYNSNWTENAMEKFKFHYKITRENISLTLQAEALLNKKDH